MSPRAAWRLVTLGFERVYDYAPGNVDWLARGLPTAGSGAREERAGQRSRTDVATCLLDDRVGDVAALVAASPHDFALVTTRGIMPGRLGAEGRGLAAVPGR